MFQKIGGFFKSLKEKYNNLSVRTRKIIYYSILGIFVATFIVCAVILGKYALNSGVETNRYNELAELAEQIRQELATQGTNADGSPKPGPNPSYDPNSPILPEYQAIYALNNDMVGWIRIPGTNIDYPVMQNTSEKNYYLKRNFDKTYSDWGCIYVREECDVFRPSDNVVIYGHYKSDGTMFHDLHGYYKKDYWESHKYIQFDTIYERQTYEIIAVFKTTAILGSGYSYHTFNDTNSASEFDHFVDTVKSMSFYETGVDAQYGDTLITLSTCEYTEEEGRLVVVAKRIS